MSTGNFVAALLFLFVTAFVGFFLGVDSQKHQAEKSPRLIPLPQEMERAKLVIQEVEGGKGWFFRAGEDIYTCFHPDDGHVECWKHTLWRLQ